jgi:glyoxylate carboligase
MLRSIAAVLVGLLLTTGVRAAGPADYSAVDELADFNAAVETAAGHNRVALGYLRTDNIDLAAIELERMHAAWIALVKLYGQKPPATLRDNPRYAATLHDVRFFITTAIAMLGSGQVGAAREALEMNRQLLHGMRQASGVEVLADCVIDVNAAMAAFFAFDEKPLDWSKPDASADVASKANALAAAAKHCDVIAPAEVQRSPEFRRLIDGIIAALAFVPTAISTRDTDMMHRVIGELRAFDQLLTFRFG